MKTKERLMAWFATHRRSSRMAFLLATATRLIGSAMALLWTRWLLQVMGDKTYGLFISFQALVSFGAMGDFGLGGTVGIQANRLLGAQRYDALKVFLAMARSAFLLIAAVAAGGFFLCSPWLARSLGFASASPIPLLFGVGAIMIGGTVLANFTTALSNACQNLTWPILPTLLIAQAAIALHFWLAKLGLALWAQMLPYAGATILMMLIPWIFVRISHPQLAELRINPIRWAEARPFFAQGFWVYLWSFGFLVYTTTDRLVINRFFGPEIASLYYVNYKPAELAVFLLVTLTFFSLTKIIQWHFSPALGDQQQAVSAAVKLQSVEVFLGVAAGLTYIAFNELFIELWLGGGHKCSLLLQGLFAANLAVTVSGDAGTKIAGQISTRGTVFAGAMVALTGIFNLVLSILAARAGWLEGIVGATLVAQMFFGITTGVFTASKLGLSKWRWIFRATVLPFVVLSLFFLLRQHVAASSLGTAFLLFLVLSGAIVGTGLLVGINRKLLQEEWSLLRSMLKQ